MIATRIREALQAEAARARAVDVRIGLGYTAVLTDSECAGVAYTPREDLDHGCSPLREAGSLAGRRVSDLLPYLESRKPIERAIGLAAANALVAARPPAPVTGGDILGALALRPADRVGMVGCFEPLIASLHAQVSSLTVFERSGDRAGTCSRQSARSTCCRPAAWPLSLPPPCLRTPWILCLTRRPDAARWLCWDRPLLCYPRCSWGHRPPGFRESGLHARRMSCGSSARAAAPGISLPMSRRSICAFHAGVGISPAPPGGMSPPSHRAHRGRRRQRQTTGTRQE